MGIIKKYRRIILFIIAVFLLLGVVFKFLHMPVGNYLLWIALVTGVLMFLFEAFNRTVENKH
jgi:hypothetical protein